MKSFTQYLTEKFYEGEKKLGAPDNGIRFLTWSRHDFSNEFNMDATDATDEKILDILKSTEDKILELDGFKIYSPTGSEYIVDSETALKLYAREITAEDAFSENWLQIKQIWPKDKYQLIDQLISETEDIVLTTLKNTAQEQGIKYWDE